MEVRCSGVAVWQCVQTRGCVCVCVGCAVGGVVCVVTVGHINLWEECNNVTNGSVMEKVKARWGK